MKETFIYSFYFELLLLLIFFKLYKKHEKKLVCTMRI
jgi:hypothetical protein